MLRVLVFDTITVPPTNYCTSLLSSVDDTTTEKKSLMLAESNYNQSMGGSIQIVLVPAAAPFAVGADK